MWAWRITVRFGFLFSLQLGPRCRPNPPRLLSLAFLALWFTLVTFFTGLVSPRTEFPPSALVHLPLRTASPIVSIKRTVLSPPVLQPPLSPVVLICRGRDHSRFASLLPTNSSRGYLYYSRAPHSQLRRGIFPRRGWSCPQPYVGPGQFPSDPQPGA